MSNEFLTVFSNPLILVSLFSAFGASVASGIIGSYVVVKRIVSVAGSISHSVLSGLGAALFFQRTYGIEWLSPIYGALFTAILSAFVIGWVHTYYKEREDAVIAMIWSVGMGLGMIFISQTPGYNVEIMDFFLGNILWTSKNDLWILGILDLLIVIATIGFHKQFLALCFDEKHAELQGISVRQLYFLLLALTAITVVVLVNIVGIVLVLCMLALPASIASNVTKKVSSMIFLSIILNIFFCSGGLTVSYFLDWPAGATIAVLTGLSYLLTLSFKVSSRFASPSPAKAETSKIVFGSPRK